MKLKHNPLIEHMKTYHLPYLLFCFMSFLFSGMAEADTCVVTDDITFECLDKEKIALSNTTDSFLGTKPELGLRLTLIDSDNQEKELTEGKLPDGVEITEGVKIRVSYFLVNGLTKALVEGQYLPLEEGKFDADGDPIDNQSIYDFISWYSGDKSNLKNKLLEIKPPYDEVTITSDICINGTTLTVGSRPYTYTGDPKSGDPFYITISDALGNPYVLNQCTGYLSEKNVLVEIKNQQTGKTFVDQTGRNQAQQQDATLGEELTATLWVKKPKDPAIDAAPEEYIDVTEQYEQTIVWGYKIKANDFLQNPDGGKTAGTEEIIWMDGKQAVAKDVKEEDVNTTGKRTFTVQTTNNNARALQSTNHSEQSMRVIFKFGETE